jgi:ribosome-interacting GTPase 1
VGCRELETVGLRLNKKPPNIFFRKKVPTDAAFRPFED